MLGDVPPPARYFAPRRPWRRTRWYGLLILLAAYVGILLFGRLLLTPEAYPLTAALCIVAAIVLIPATWRYQADGDVEVIRLIIAANPCNFAGTLSELGDVYGLDHRERSQLTRIGAASRDHVEALSRTVGRHTRRVGYGVTDPLFVQVLVDLLLTIVGAFVGRLAQEIYGPPPLSSFSTPRLEDLTRLIVVMLSVSAVLVVLVRSYGSARAARQREEAELSAHTQDPQGMFRLLTEWLPTTSEVRRKVAREARTLTSLSVAYASSRPDEFEEIASGMLDPSGAKVASYQLTVAFFLSGVLLGAIAGAFS